MGGGEGTPWQVCPLYSTAGPIKAQKGYEKVTRITHHLIDDLKVPCEQAHLCKFGKKNLPAVSAKYKVPARRLSLTNVKTLALKEV